ncbi:CoA pyrophosphatase [Undibacterium sp. TJN25]|uniref:CoA pyrophosphatase n=1 Tax=Undibacterium sp. TJN25 TaxID=3413056 RepID=UPI003BF138CD
MAKLLFNPEQLPVVSVAEEGAIPAERLNADWLRRHFAELPPWSVETSDEQLLAAVETFRPASVLIPIVIRPEGLSLLLTHRAAHLNDHAGQISFPGGRFEVADITPVETALREAEEEIGLDRKHVEIIGTLPEYKTGTGYVVTPIVSLLHPPFELKADPFEVAEIFEVPLAFLMNGDNHQRRAFHLPDGAGKRVFYSMPYHHHFIWGATAGMLRNLFHLLRA